MGIIISQYKYNWIGLYPYGILPHNNTWGLDPWKTGCLLNKPLYGSLIKQPVFQWQGSFFFSLAPAELVKSLMTYVPKKLRLMEESMICSDVFERFGWFLKPECPRLVVWDLFCFNAKIWGWRSQHLFKWVASPAPSCKIHRGEKTNRPLTCFAGFQQQIPFWIQRSSQHKTVPRAKKVTFWFRCCREDLIMLTSNFLWEFETTFPDSRVTSWMFRMQLQQNW